MCVCVFLLLGNLQKKILWEEYLQLSYFEKPWVLKREFGNSRERSTSVVLLGYDELQLKQDYDA